MSGLGRRTALGLVSLVIAASGALVLGGTASAAVHKSTQCPQGQQLNPNNTQQCTPVGSPTDNQSSTPAGSQSTTQP